jgi:AraC-like DNA-binding protein
MFISTYHEKGRQSICNAQIHRENITFSYELKDHEGFPFAGCYFRKRDSSDFITKLAGLNELEITIKSEEGKRIPILLKLNYPPFHDKNDFRELTLEYVLEYEKAGTYNIPLSEFKVPSWWFRAHGIKKESIDLKNYDELMFFVVESCESIATDVKDRIEISKIKFSHNNNHLYLNSAIMLMVLGLGIFGIRIVEKQKAKQATIFVPQSEEKQTKKKSFIEEDTPFFKMKTYINLNYQNPDLDAKKLSKATGVSTREIGSVFKKASGDTFKSYLNHVRMTEVKRLLKSTELSVSEIAYKCGYNQIPHFNRIFKKETGLSPKQYRDIE